MNQKDNIHVLIIPSWYPLFTGDINGSFFREQAIALKKRNLRVGVIYPCEINWRDVLKNKKIIKKDEDAGVIIYKKTFFSIPKQKKLNATNWIKCGIKLFEIYVKENGMPDIIHVHSILNAGLLADKINKKYKIPFVVTEHSTTYARGLIGPNDISKIKNVASTAKVCIAVSNEFKSYLNNKFDSKKWIYLPNIVNQIFLDHTLQKKSEFGKFKFVNICFLHSKKNIDLLIKAFYLVQNQIKNVELAIGGDGPELNKLRNLVFDLGLNHNVKFYGKLSRMEVLDVLTNSNVFVLSSDYETFGVVVIEAMALGLPVISTKCGGPESIITSDDLGYLVDKNSPELLSEAMVKMYKNYLEKESCMIRDYCNDNFSEKAVTDKLINIYKTHV